MTKAGKYWVLAIIMGVLGLVEAVTGFVLWMGFPEGGGGGGRLSGGISNLEYWGLTKHTWVGIHDWVALALVVMVVIHIAVHWKWIVRVGRSLTGRKDRVAVPVTVRS
jgi:hypothetical protein